MTTPAYTPTSAEVEAGNLINKTRVAHGKHTLILDARLCYWAAWHTRAMVGKNTIFHSTSAQLTSYANSVSTAWRIFAENVGMTALTPGDRVVALHNAFVASSEHLYNMDLSGTTRMGVGIRSSSKAMFETQLFWG